MRLRLETSRGLVRAAAAGLNLAAAARHRGSVLPELAKLHVSASAVAAFRRRGPGIRGLGYAEDAQIVQRLADALGTRISSGTSDMQREVVAAKLGVRGRDRWGIRTPLTMARCPHVWSGRSAGIRAGQASGARAVPQGQLRRT